MLPHPPYSQRLLWAPFSTAVSCHLEQVGASQWSIKGKQVQALPFFNVPPHSLGAVLTPLAGKGSLWPDGFTLSRPDRCLKLSLILMGNQFWDSALQVLDLMSCTFLCRFTVVISQDLWGLVNFNILLCMIPQCVEYEKLAWKYVGKRGMTWVGS